MDEFVTKNIPTPRNEQGNNNHDGVALPTCPINHNKTRTQKEERKQEKEIDWHIRIQSASSVVMAICTFAIAGITLFYTYYAREQVGQMRQAVEESRKMREDSNKSSTDILEKMREQSAAMQAAADANKKAVELSERGIKGTQEQSHLDQRAWMGSADVPKWEVVVNRPLKVTIFLKNLGKTPAKKTQVAGVIEIVPENGSPNFTLENTAKRSRAVLVFPQQVVSHDFDVISPQTTVLDSTILNDIRTGKKRIYVHGINTYFDIFNRHQWATFCFFLGADGSKSELCEEHNDTGSY